MKKKEHKQKKDPWLRSPSLPWLLSDENWTLGQKRDEMFKKESRGKVEPCDRQNQESEHGRAVSFSIATTSLWLSSHAGKMATVGPCLLYLANHTTISAWSWSSLSQLKSTWVSCRLPCCGLATHPVDEGRRDTVTECPSRLYTMRAVLRRQQLGTAVCHNAG